MTVLSFSAPRKITTLARFAPVVLVAFLATVPLMDAVSNSAAVEQLTRAPSAVSLDDSSTPVIAVAPGASHIERLKAFAESFPPVCWEGTEVNELQRERCASLWREGCLLVLLAGLPLVGALLAVWACLAMVNGFYRRARARLEADGAPAFRGKVSPAPKSGGGAFGYFYGLRCVVVEGPARGERLEVYLPENAPEPLSGEVLSVYELGTIWGQRRRIGQLYAPHLSVVSQRG